MTDETPGRSPDVTAPTATPPPRVREHFATRARTAYGRTNARVALAVTRGVSTMTCAYLFAALALVGLPGAVSGGLLAIVQWVAQTFIQLVFLSILAVGQRVAADAADARAEATYRDAEQVLAEHAETRAQLEAVRADLAVLDRLARAPRRSGLVELRPLTAEEP